MKVLKALICRMFENGDKFLECLILTSSSAVRLHNMVGPPPATSDFLPKMSQMNEFSTSSFQRSSSLYWYLIGPFLPIEAIVLVVHRLLGQSRENTEVLFYDHPTCRLVAFLLKQLRDRVDGSNNDDSIMALHAMAVLDAWMRFDASQLTDDVFIELVLELENSLHWTLSGAYSSLALLIYDHVAIIHRYIETKVVTCNWCTHSQKCLLTVLVSLDPVKFGAAFFQVYSNMKSNKKYQQILNCGILDTSMAVILNHDITRKTHQEELVSIIQGVNKRLLALRFDFNITTDKMNAFISLARNLMDMKSESVADMLEINLVADLLARLLIQSKQEINQTTNLPCHQYVEVALYICMQCSTDSDSIKDLSSTLFLYLYDVIALLLSHHRANGSHTSGDGMPQSIQPIIWMKKLMATDVAFDLTAKDNGAAKLRSLLKICLRHGMQNESDGSNEIRTMCLHLVSLLISFSSSGGKPLGCHDGMERTGKYQSIPSQVFNMVVSHSKFDVLMRSFGNSCIQIEISRILFTCITNAADIEFSMPTWTSLLACYDCGVDGKDKFLRCVLVEYSQIANKVRVGKADVLLQVVWSANLLFPGSRYIIICM